jgi:hypothetical protein
MTQGGKAPLKHEVFSFVISVIEDWRMYLAYCASTVNLLFSSWS